MKTLMPKAAVILIGLGCTWAAICQPQTASLIGREVAVPAHLLDGQEFELSLSDLLTYGKQLFSAKWTSEEGEGRSMAKGTANGAPLSNGQVPLVFPNDFNRISGPDSNYCFGCHNEPFEGGGGDRATEVFVLGQRFDFVTFDHIDSVATEGAMDESGRFVTLQDVADERRTVGMNGSGFIEMLARQMTADLQTIRDSIRPGQTRALMSKGILFGALTRRADGSWDTSKVQGLPAPSLNTENGAPDLLILPFSQAGAFVSLRDFTNSAFNQHFGMQTEERFGVGIDEDHDGFVNELTRADVTAITLYQATLPIPGQVISRDPAVRRAIQLGTQWFQQIGCSSCHVPALPLVNRGWIYTEPNPYNPTGDLQVGDIPAISVDLTSDQLPGPRLKADATGVVWVPAFTDLKLHDITGGPDDPNAEPLDQNESAGSDAFFAGNRKFITRKLWGVGNSGPYMHHGKFTTMREAILAHSGEALQQREAFQHLSGYERDCVIEFLKSLQILTPGTQNSIVQ
jgi:hypothetical protein